MTYKSFLPFADHGGVLIAFRLPPFGEIGISTEIKRLHADQALVTSDSFSNSPGSRGQATMRIFRMGYIVS